MKTNNQILQGDQARREESGHQMQKTCSFLRWTSAEFRCAW